MTPIKGRTPVRCQNGHEAHWYWEIYGLAIIKNHGVPSGDKCQCPKFSVGEGYTRCGDDQLFIGRRDKNNIDIYVGDTVRVGNQTGVVYFDSRFLCYNIKGFYNSSYDYPCLAFSEGAEIEVLCIDAIG